jgi:hypothetical protein
VHINGEVISTSAMPSGALPEQAMLRITAESAAIARRKGAVQHRLRAAKDEPASNRWHIIWTHPHNQTAAA